LVAAQAHAGGHNLSGAPRVAMFYDFVKRPALFKLDAEAASEPSENGDGPPPPVRPAGPPTLTSLQSA